MLTATACCPYEKHLPEHHFSDSKTSPSKSDGLYSKLTEKLWQQIET